RTVRRIVVCLIEPEVYSSYSLVVVVFFSSRRRHTRLVSDWSSDVCSSDLQVWPIDLPRLPAWIRERLGRHKLQADAAAASLLAEIGRASCRGKGEISGGGGSVEKKKRTSEKRKKSEGGTKHARLQITTRTS